MPVKDMVGLRFSRLTVMSRNGSDANGNARWVCVCDCGATKSILGQSLRYGSTTSCGCANKEILRSQVTHGASGTKEYFAWHGMLQRCNNPNHTKWHRYGARGITVCERWQVYENFLKDMGPRPPGMTVDRKDNDGNYEPSNCRWASQMTQGNNRSNNRLFLIDEKTLTLSEACRLYGINKGTVQGRLSFGWEIDAAFKTPVTNQKENHA